MPHWQVWNLSHLGGLGGCAGDGGGAGQWGWDMRLGGNRCREKADQGGVQGGQGGGRINSVQSRRRVEEDETEPLTMTLACSSLLGAGGR